MSPTHSPIPPLVRKELRQVRRSRGALLSSTLLPFFMLVIMPLGQLLALRAATEEAQEQGMEMGPLPGMADFTDPTQFFLQFLFPLFVTMGGLIVPSVAATYTVIAEREKRSLELLMALPVRVRDILMAKVLAMLVMAMGVVLPLFTIDAAMLLILGLASPGYIVLLLLVLCAALTCSLGIALLLALLARDFRTANNLNGVIVGPLVLLTIGTLFGVPGDARLLALIGVLLLAAGLALLASLRWLTFERYLA